MAPAGNLYSASRCLAVTNEPLRNVKICMDINNKYTYKLCTEHFHYQLIIPNMATMRYVEVT
jgi:hypothetical protein